MKEWCHSRYINNFLVFASSLVLGLSFAFPFCELKWRECLAQVRIGWPCALPRTSW